ncbi:MAG: hypothetical protein ABI723_15350 [Bacteroidia bacterium]
MKKLNIIACLIIFICYASYSQDIIYKRNGEKIKSKVIEVTPREIKYKEFNFEQGPVFSIAKSEVTQVIYESGLKEIFESPGSKKSSSFSRFEQGQMDARAYYNGGTGASIATGLSTFVFWPISGLVCAAICTSIPPSINSLQINDPALLRDNEYMQGYQMQAQKIKNHKVWRGFVIANGVIVVAVVVIIVVLINQNEFY